MINLTNFTINPLDNTITPTQWCAEQIRIQCTYNRSQPIMIICVLMIIISIVIILWRYNETLEPILQINKYTLETFAYKLLNIVVILMVITMMYYQFFNT